MSETRRTLSLVHSEYQPRKAELKAPIDIRREDGTQPTPEELAHVALQTVDINGRNRPSAPFDPQTLEPRGTVR